MPKKKIEYNSLVDALVAVAKRLSRYEGSYNMSSEDFFDRFCKGLSDDKVDFIEWANDYRHYMAIRAEIEGQLQDVA